MSNENRQQWYKAAEVWEQDFVSQYGEKFNIILNPSKSKSPYAPDLYCLNTSKSADLKLQKKPFFTAKKLYGIDPNYCWTFNVSDLFEYVCKYDYSFGLFIWVVHDKAEQYNIQVEEAEAVYYTTIGLLKDHVARKGKIHEYSRRINDTNGNAYGSYAFDLSSKIFTKL
jgi:hypothetical protein